MPVKWSKETMRDGLLAAMLVLCGAGLLLCSRPVSAAVAEALDLCIRVLLPSLYPFFVLSALLVSSGMVQHLAPRLEKPMHGLFGLPGSCAVALALGAVGGYPVGARTAAALYRQGLCSKEQGEKVLQFCNNAGPAFLISVVGSGLLQNTGLGVKLYGIHLASAVIIGFILRGNTRAVKQTRYTVFQYKKTPLFFLFLQAVTQSFSTWLNVCAFVIIFAVLMCLLEQTPVLPFFSAGLPGGDALWHGLLSGMLELTSGTAALAQSGLHQAVLLPALSFLCGWGGLSVQFQTISLLQEAGLPCRRYLKAKLLQGVLAAILTVVFCR